MSRSIKIISWLFNSVIVLIVAAVIWMSFDPNVVFNNTDSMPQGLWYRTDQPCCKRDDVVLLDTRLIAVHKGQDFRQGISYGYFGADQPLMKRIKAISGDSVAMSDDGIRVNGHLLPGTRAAARDSLGRTLIRADFKRSLDQDEFLTVGDGVKSFDARYFGVIRRDEIITTVIPLVTFD